MLLQPKIDKTHWVSISTPNDNRIVKGSLWSKASTGELYICTAIAPVVFTLLTGGSGAPVGSRYVIIGPADGTLTDERVLTAGANITITDNGPGGTVVIAGAAGGAGSADETLGWLGL